ncbi:MULTISPECIES: hypothetical protein [unclassified Streptomyces]|uniref:hypothetical protein n=1 Tax=unclassified Streptomyces TaxID=2593676 RepID=UPI000DC7B731|nr:MULTISPECIES: hypothetical protein [unclassified Streptomyces]AWZ07516.1 hypothetical protein DRB89_26175 [Streptomyces sp. ICC4]AWZ15490.1 hypothetical protein DRB96_28115 [Streptomyces sp. ICC1]
MRDDPLAELRRIESDPAYRARFRALLDAALVRRAAADAARRMRGVLEARTADDAAAAVTVTLGAVVWTCCLAFAAARGGIT